MTIADVLLVDFDGEAASTRRVLERVPDDRGDWKPHEKSMTLAALVTHVASLPAFGNIILTTPHFDFSTGSFPKYEFTTSADAVDHAAGLAAQVRTSLSSLSDDDLQAEWGLFFQGNPIARAPRCVLYRTMFFNHLVHHRGQLTVYLRLLGVAVPGIYGPSADEPFNG